MRGFWLYGECLGVWPYAVFAPTSVWKMSEVVNRPFFCIRLVRFPQRFTGPYYFRIIGTDDLVGFAAEHFTNFSRDVGIIDLRPSIIIPSHRPHIGVIIVKGLIGMQR